MLCSRVRLSCQEGGCKQAGSGNWGGMEEGRVSEWKVSRVSGEQAATAPQKLNTSPMEI